jgi:hypothetical protein
MNVSCPIERSPFASRSVIEHLARGVGAVAFIVFAVHVADAGNWKAMVGAPASLIGALVLMRGCPTCWVMGLIATFSDRSRPINDQNPKHETSDWQTIGQKN